jgi:hypothetical protein
MDKVAALMLALGISACAASQPVQPTVAPPEPFALPTPLAMLESGVRIRYVMNGTPKGPVCTYTYDVGFKTEDISDDIHLVVSSEGPKSSLTLGGVEMPPYDECTPEQQQQWRNAGSSFMQAMHSYGWILYFVDVCSDD